MWVQIKTNCSSKWNPTLTAGTKIDLDADSARDLIARGLAFEVPPQVAQTLPGDATKYADGVGKFSTPAGGGGGGDLQVATVTLTAAQIKALGATPITVVAAPGAGKYINVVNAVAQYKFGTVPFTFPAALSPAAPLLVGFPGGVMWGTAYAASFKGTGALDQSRSWVLANEYALNNPVGVEARQDAAENQALKAYIENYGPVVSTALVDGGSGYAPGDTGTITTADGGTAPAYVVDTVDGGGAVLTYHLTDPGTADTNSNPFSTATGGAQAGSGTGFKVNVTAVTPAELTNGDGTITLTVYYTVVTLS